MATRRRAPGLALHTTAEPWRRFVGRTLCGPPHIWRPRLPMPSCRAKSRHPWAKHLETATAPPPVPEEADGHTPLSLLGHPYIRPATYPVRRDRPGVGPFYPRLRSVLFYRLDPCFTPRRSTLPNLAHLGADDRRLRPTRTGLLPYPAHTHGGTPVVWRDRPRVGPFPPFRLGPFPRAPSQSPLFSTFSFLSPLSSPLAHKSPLTAFS